MIFDGVTAGHGNSAGIDPTAFIQLAGYVGQISGTLGLGDQDRAALERVAQELHDEATSPNPEPGRMRQFATQVKEKLLEAGTTMAATVGVQMAEQALGTVMWPRLPATPRPEGASSLGPWRIRCLVVWRRS